MLSSKYFLKSILIIITITLYTPLFGFKKAYYLYAQGIIDLQEKRYKSAIEKFERVIRYDPDAYYVYPQLIYLYALEKQNDKINLFIKEIEKIEIDTTTLTNIANTLWSVGYAEDAGKIFEKVLTITPDNSQLLLTLAQIYFSIDEEKSINYYKRYLELNPNDTNAYFQLALIEYKKGNTERAKEYLQNLENNEIISSIISQENLTETTTDYNSLISHYEKYIKEIPNDHKAVANLFFLLLTQQDVEKAEKYIKKMLSIPKKEFLPEYNFLIALFYELKKDFKNAIKYMGKYIRTAEISEVLPYMKMIYYYYSIKNYKKAINLLEWVNKKFNNVEVKSILLYAYIEKKNYKQALDILFELKTSSPSFERIDFYIGMCYEQIGDIENSIKYLKEAIKQNPKDHEALNYLGYLYAEKGINLDEAEELIKKALEFEPTNYAYIDSLAWVYYKKGDYYKSEELFEKIKEYKDPIIYEHIGDVKKKLNKLEEALFFYENSLKLNKKNKNIKKKISELKYKWKSLHRQK